MKLLDKGQKVWVSCIGYNRKDWEGIEEGEVTHCGRKYVTVKVKWREEKFNIEKEFQHVTDYSPNYKLWLKDKDYYDEAESIRIRKILSQKILNIVERASLDELIKLAKALNIPIDVGQTETGGSQK